MVQYQNELFLYKWINIFVDRNQKLEVFITQSEKGGVSCNFSQRFYGISRKPLLSMLADERRHRSLFWYPRLVGSWVGVRTLTTELAQQPMRGIERPHIRELAVRRITEARGSCSTVERRHFLVPN
ncbi:hypothetical protein AVEN_125753-1 [Araneus ventricosus]|uniref:Uncharacterized protein n=1 Tax=Araneus ventricosus TaxID=182803 RepID=A0A4Y2MYV3_ARAVE|nr:hypothetical protein AVEN_125753-1 [Araneus ventricosus]